MDKSLKINNQTVAVSAALVGITLLDFIRDHVGLKGTKYGCGMGHCGACTVHLDGAAVRSCLHSVEDVIGTNVVTIEGLAGRERAGELHPLQRAWIEESVPQCGYCQPGQIMTAAAFLQDKPDPTDDEIRAAMSGNLCRCGTYQRIRLAIARAAREARHGDRS